jgi:hypothetical protein
MTALKISNPLLAKALDAHGGLDRWRSFTGMSSTIVSGGTLWALKGAPMIPIARTAVTDFARQWTSVTPFGKADWTMTWTPDRVIVEDASGDLIAERDDPRTAFAGHGYDSPWDPLNLAYFNGYAMWTYHALPFVLAEPGYEISDAAPILQDGQRLRGLSVRFPASVHSHSRDQRFFFSDDGLLARHEYQVEVWAGTAAAHLLSDYIEVDGIKLPTRRRVHPRRPDGSIEGDVEIVTIDLSNYAFRQ